ncbi:GNAT family N-acetyltransferase [Siminovitchia acidinfaciens]|uniref:GNAT family N-acetyltransferase n=1 Tax=Siminovitchia acidinfaciens TaxID=2321395 RepID=A0A429Y6X0_9BACI|nr:GNAT family N-acetyltransferase [Siminovitchia acidinfaciens]RST77138.1 GNAT family N-acetyltransferase [Siminovitchia acidinfaciens]
MTSTIEIRVLSSNEEMKQMQQLEEFIWQGEGGIPAHQTITAVQNGGLAIGAYSQGELVGFSYSFPGFKGGKTYLCSHNMGIHPEFRDKGIGASLKTRQKEEAALIGYDMLTWTYDPLETRNGYLNLSKLSAICSTYIENCYGDSEDEFNAGLPTDRFKVEWWIQSRHVNERIPTPVRDDAYYIPLEDSKSGPVLADEVKLPENGQILVPVPAAFQTIKQEDMKLALDWRLKTRAVFQQLFQNGYAAISLERSEEGPVHHYLLVKRSELQI